MRVHAPAKINLHLRVGPPTADGFHPLVSWMVTVGLFDTLDLRLRPADPGVAVTCDDPAIPCDGSNLVARAASALLDSAAAIERDAGVTPAAAPVGVSVALRKRIPVGAGLGGGSSDGAAVMTALNTLLALGHPPERLAAVAARLGSDLPFFFHGPSALCTGRGEIVRPAPRPARARWAVLILPPIHMPTPAVYRQFDAMNLGQPDALAGPPDLARWATLSSEQLLPLLVNDLEAPAFAIDGDKAQAAGAPARMTLSDYHRRAADVLGRIVRMSGSGSSLFSLYDDAAAASDAAAKVRAKLGARTVAAELCPALGTGTENVIAPDPV